jgi:hypothetical protein
MMDVLVNCSIFVILSRRPLLFIQKKILEIGGIIGHDAIGTELHDMLEISFLILDPCKDLDPSQLQDVEEIRTQEEEIDNLRIDSKISRTRSKRVGMEVRNLQEGLSKLHKRKKSRPSLL